MEWEKSQYRSFINSIADEMLAMRGLENQNELQESQQPKQKTKNALMRVVSSLADSPKILKDGKEITRRQFLQELEEFLNHYNGEIH